ncbi:GNAT family N-acetyltransferase [Halalkalibacter hemicellulosilyticus]|uniref:Aminoglycoside N6'-acetyltransferase n=1 Tax=Halalkalibacter hemicellulosilyticusJCM 9152 TaxID=1236971 RepID=W4QBQ4_9BACI|nr:GNAT family protein [Halalkalibacter hemicellulosilyticus]GAE29430.1 aminoglycoside N6'-acetyltransferase [Halalkalibacter hemicellulosilyticusJCM 9152]
MVELIFFERANVKQLINWIETPEFLLQWGGPAFRFPLDEQQLESYLENANKDYSTIFVYSVIEKETRKVIGHISLGKIDRLNRSARIGKVLVGEKSKRGQGIGQQMMTEILKVAFEELRLHRVSLGVFDFNVAAIACYEKLGFVKEGLLRESRKMGDQYWSSWEMSILEHEWFERDKVLV